MSERPVLSFCVPTWNRAQIVYNCIKHILSYEGDDIQVVVSNNASTDNTLELLNSIHDSRLKIYSNDKNINILNWPFVVSHADGEWAALMSDEDIVCIQNIPHYLKMLREAGHAGVGVVTYSFLPIFHYASEYTCRNQIESISMAGRHSGHITGHVVNMQYFHLGDLSEWDYAKNLYEQRERKIPPLSSFITEPQQELVLRAAQISLVKYTKVPLCSFGADQDKSKLSITSDDLNKLDGLCFMNSEHIAAALYNKIEMHHKAACITDDDDNGIQYASAIMNVLERMVCVSLDCFHGIYRGDHRYRPALFALAKKEFHFSLDDVKNKTLAELKGFIDKYPPFVAEEAFTCLYDYLKELFDENPFKPLGDTLSFELRVLLGNTLQMAYLGYIIHSSSKRNSKGRYQEIFIEEVNDALEFRETHKMIRHLHKKQYNVVINDFEHVKSHRKHFLIGRAYFHKAMWEKAKSEFDQFLRVSENPYCIADIVTGSYSIQSTFYYLGYIHQKLGDHYAALGYYSRCKDLSDKLMIGWNIYDKRLGL